MTITTNFISGVDIGRLFYRNIIEPVIKNNFPALKYAAALIGPGSEVLGFDTALSTDHDWQPRVFIFIENEAFEHFRPLVSKLIAASVPDTFMGFPTAASHNDDVRSHAVYSVDSFWQKYLGFSSQKVPKPEDWLTFPEHRLLGLTSGAVYFDGAGELEAARKRFHYYPDDIRLYMAVTEWRHIAQEEAFLGRSGDVGDEVGSQIIAARLIRHIMRLCFILEQQYCPYSKWFGTAFSKLHCSPKLSSLINDVLGQKHWKEREKKMSSLYSALTDVFEAQNMVDVKFEAKISNYHTRPYQVLNADRFADALREQIVSEDVRQLKPNIGAVEQFIDSTDILTSPDMCKKLKSIYT